MNTKILLFILSAFISINLIAQKRLDKQDFSSMYNINSVDLHPKFQVYHNTDSSSTLFYELNNSELEYVMNMDSTFISSAKINYQIYNNYKAKELIDSGSFIYIDSLNYRKNNSTLGQLTLNINEGENYVLQLQYSDLNTNASVNKIIEIEKENRTSRQNFYLKGNDQLPFIKNYMSGIEEFNLVNQTSVDNNISVRYFKAINSIPKPPMITSIKKTKGYSADTLFNLSFDNGETGNIKLSDIGFYHFFLDSKKKDGYTIFRFSDEYPYVISDKQMLLPLRYITTGKEFKALYNSKDKTKDIKDFWIKLAGDEENSQGLINFFYNRVENANINFTSDREGWSTDRGMIYIIYGEPDMVFKNADMETWKYNTNNSTPLVFDFYKVETPFTDNHFILQRDESYKYSWNIAIQNIRKQ